MGSSGLVAIHSAALIMRGEEPPAERWNPASAGQSEIGRFEDGDDRQLGG